MPSEQAHPQHPRTPPGRSWRETSSSLALGVALFAVYAWGACPTIYVGDSGELVTAVHTLGIPHPTGYPLYVLLGKLWTILLPLGSIAWRMSLFSAACAAAACALLHRLCRTLGLDGVPALVASLLLAFSPSFWGEANVQRVYALNALFVALALTFAVRWQRRRQPRDLALLFFACGLGATNHTVMAIVAAAASLFAVITAPRDSLRPRAAAAAAAGFVLGLLPYAYLPLRSRMNPPLDWGNPETLDAAIAVVTRRDFWGRAWLESPADVAPIVADYLRSLSAELTLLGAALAVVGLALGRRRGPVLLAVLVMLGNLAALMMHGSRSDIFLWHRYYIPSYAMAALLAGIGCQVVLERLPRALLWIPLAAPLYLLVSGWPQFDRSRYRIAEDYSQKVLDGLPPGSHLIASDDNVLFVLIYLLLVEGRRPDVDLILQGVGDADLPPLRFDPARDPLYFTHHPNWSVPGLDIVPMGLAFRAWRSGQPPPAPRLPATPLDGAGDARVPKDYLTRNLIGNFHYMIGVTAETLDWRTARRAFGEAAAASPENDVLFYNLGLIFARNGLIDDALAAFRRSQAINPRHLPSSSRPRAADRVREMEVELRRLDALRATFATDPGLQAVPAGSPAHYHRLAELFAASGETLAARGARLRGQEAAWEG